LAGDNVPVSGNPGVPLSGLTAIDFSTKSLDLTSKLCRFTLDLSAESLSKMAIQSLGKKEILCKKISCYSVSGLCTVAAEPDKWPLFHW